MPDKYVSPQVRQDAFHCPHCETFAHQKWEKIMARLAGTRGRGQVYDSQIGQCQRCGDYTIWVGEKMVFPGGTPAPQPNEDMPEDVKKDYEEARQVVNESPRSAAALLRLAMEKLTSDLTGNEDQSLYQNIGDLVDEGRIDERIQQALDSVRVTGNDMVHAGEIYNDDDRETALRLFDLVNVIVELTVSREKMIEEAYTEIPENKKQGIEQRDR